ITSRGATLRTLLLAFLDDNLLFALCQANKRYAAVTRRVTRTDSRIQLPLAAINQYQARQAPLLAILFAETAGNCFMYVVKIVIAVSFGLELAVLTLVAHAVRKHHHASNYIRTLHMTDVVALDTPWESRQPK